MTHLLIRYFIKNYQEVKSASVRAAYGRLGSIVGILTNILLCSLKIGVGFFFNSVAILADGINNLSDAGSSIVTLIGFKLSSKPADEDHPFGHARIEYIAGLIISFIILLLGLELIRSSFLKILNPEALVVNGAMFFVLIISILIKLWLSAFNYKLGNMIDSTTLKATAADSRNDVIATVAILISMIVMYFTHIQLDGIMGVIVGLFILYSGYTILKETMDPLLGQAPDTELTASLSEKLLSYDGILGFHDLMLHSYGPNIYFASVHLEVPAEEPLLSCHDKLDRIERDVKMLFNVDLVIHPDPVVTSDEKTLALKKQVADLVSAIHDDLSIHDFRSVMSSAHTRLIFDVLVPPNYKTSPENLAKIIDKLVKTLDPTFSTVITIDMNYTSTSIQSD